MVGSRSTCLHEATHDTVTQEELAIAEGHSWNDGVVRTLSALEADAPFSFAGRSVGDVCNNWPLPRERSGDQGSG